jgi:glycosyltransferase involved in cell wall biosynthesis
MQSDVSSQYPQISPNRRIGLDTSFLDRPPSGIGVYVAALRRWIPQVAQDLELVELRPDASSMLNRLGERGSRFAWEYGAAGVNARRERVELLHMPMMAVPILTRIPVVTTVHDVIPYVMPEYRSSRAQQVNLAVAMKMVRRATAVITPSQHAASDVAAVFGVPRDRIWVTPEAADERYVPQPDRSAIQPVLNRFGICGPYVFNIGGVDVRKNLPALLRAFRELVPVVPESVQLVIGGAPHSANPIVFPRLEPVIRELGLESRVILTGRITEEDKVALMQSAAVYVTPSLYEGFGLSVLEAMACGVPVIAANRTSLPEVVGDAGLLVEPRIEPLAAAMRAILTEPDLATALSSRGLERARQFYWRLTAEQTVAVYEHVLSERGRNH